MLPSPGLKPITTMAGSVAYNQYQAKLFRFWDYKKKMHSSTSSIEYGLPTGSKAHVTNH